jgi:hypothetical protein
MTSARTGLAIAALAVALGGSPTFSRASVPSGTPVFSDPTGFDNPFFPFEPGGVRVFEGRSEGARTYTIDSFLPGTRDFPFGGGTVSCVTMREMEFEDGELVEISINYFAESDDGTVWYFGETVDNYEEGVVVDHGGSWLVGGPTGADPEETDAVDGPALFMPANPEVGDEYMPEDVPDGPRELDRVRRVDRKVRTGIGSVEGCIEVLETDVADGSTETKWYGPGIGVLKGKAKGESFVLVASTLSEPGE